jgi:hypothetical protein
MMAACNDEVPMHATSLDIARVRRQECGATARSRFVNKGRRSTGCR